MVKNRGIEVSIISQFDIRRLPEFEDPYHKATNRSNTVSCYVPIYPGSQIWFEYTIEPPHPPNAAYFFKLLINERLVTSWDCTDKHGYHGKTIYVLEETKTQQIYPRTSVHRKCFRFCNQQDAAEYDSESSIDNIEIRVHRIEHRRRIRDKSTASDTNVERLSDGQLQLVNGGILETGRPRRRYQYQLLDPVDEPYAVFRFFYRTYEYLWQHNIIVTPAGSTSSTSSSFAFWHDVQSTSVIEDTIVSGDMTGLHRSETPPRKIQTTHVHQSPQCVHRVQDTGKDIYLPLSDSEESLSVVARDSIDDLPSTVPRSPGSPRHKRSMYYDTVQSSGSPTKQPVSPRKKLKNQLTLNLDSSSLNVEKRRRPLSPFTSGGLLRRLITPEPPSPSTPSTLTCFGQSINDNARESVETRRPESRSSQPQTSSESTQTERGGRSLIRFLSRRVARHD